MSGIAAILTMAMTLQLPTVEPTAVERTAIRSRNAIKSGVITLRCSHVGPLGKPVTTAYEFQFDGSNRFMEIADEGRPELYPLDRSTSENSVCTDSNPIHDACAIHQSCRSAIPGVR